MRFHRRAVLRAGALAGAVGVILGLRPDESVWEPQPAGGNPKLELRPTPSFVKDIYRREDQLAVRLECFNLKLLKQGQPGPGDVNVARLVKLNPAAEAFIVVDFGPQHLAEHAFFDAPVNDPRITPNRAMLAGPSRLAFKAPATPIPFSFGAVMAWKDLEPSLVAHALGAATVMAPSPIQTALEIPWRVVLSPDSAAAWTHPANPALGPGGRAGLWHTRLGQLNGRTVDERDALGRPHAEAKARVVWSPDVDGASPPDPAVPGLTSLDSQDRADLVSLTSRWNLAAGTQLYVPQPVDVEQLALSPLGAWLKSSGTWDVRPNGVDLKQWVHQAGMGRDHYVRTIYAGKVFPTGHRVELVKITQRAFEPLANGKPGAVLRQRSFIVPQQRVRTFNPGDVPFALDGMRDMPFKTIRLLTTVTPDLAQYEVGQPAEQGTKIPFGTSYMGEDGFWPRVGGANNWTDFLWEIEAEDYDGRMVRFRLPMIYVSETFSTSESRLDDLKDHYLATAAARRTCDLGGQRVALAKFTGGTHGETAYPMTAMTFGVNTFETPIPGLPRRADFTPTMTEGLIRLDGIDRIRGGSASPAYQVKLHPQWISGATNPGRVFAVLPQEPSAAFAASTSGGVATPDMKVGALSAITGPINAPNIGAVVPTAFKPAEFFAGGNSPKLFGAIDLPDILKDVPFPAGVTAMGLSPVPRLVTTDIVEGGALKGLTTGLVWETSQLKLIPVLTPGQLKLSVMTDAYLDGRPAHTVVFGELANFTFHSVKPLHLLDLVFQRFGFRCEDGGKPEVTVDFDDVVFVGALQFVNVLRQYISGGPIGVAIASTPANGGYVNVTPSGVEAGYQLTLPPVPCGAMLMENIAFGARTDIYFDGRPMRLRFNFAERHRPFVLTVMAFGGGGSLAITTGLDDLELFEMSLEFGAKLALDVGAASGSVTAMGGIHLAIGDSDGDGSDDGARLTGYLRLCGKLDVLEMVSMSVEFYLALTYLPGTKSCFGQAKVTVEVDVAFFSASVTLGPVKKTFAGGGGQSQSIASSTPKSFADMTSPEHWAAYTDMFASAAF